MKRRSAGVLLAATVIASLAGSVGAATVTFTYVYGFYTGTGNGTPVAGVLSLQGKPNPSDPLAAPNTEYGFSGWSQNSGVGGTLSGQGPSPGFSWSSTDTQVQKTTTSAGYFARSVGSLAAMGITATNLGLVFQVNQAGNQSLTANWLDVRQFEVDFIKANGDLAFTAVYTPSNAAAPAGSDYANAGGTSDNGTFPGVGQGTSGWIFNVNLSPQEQNFFNNSANMIGMQVTLANAMSDATDGADNFWFANRNASTPPPVPLPAALWAGMAMLGLLGLGKTARALRQR